MGGTPINSLLNLSAFVRVARLGSFSGVARELQVAPSVVTKRIDQLEQELGTRLLLRSTRGLTLTPAAEALLPRFVRLVAEFDELFKGGAGDDQGIEGQLRVKSPTTLTSEFLGSLYARFLQLHPGVTLDIALVDRTVNPLEEGFDCAIGALQVSYPNVVDVRCAPTRSWSVAAPTTCRAGSNRNTRRSWWTSIASRQVCSGAAGCLRVPAAP